MSTTNKASRQKRTCDCCNNTAEYLLLECADSGTKKYISFSLENSTPQEYHSMMAKLASSNANIEMFYMLCDWHSTDKMSKIGLIDSNGEIVSNLVLNLN